LFNRDICRKNRRKSPFHAFAGQKAPRIDGPPGGLQHDDQGQG
jgi:hypothetical protein